MSKLKTVIVKPRKTNKKEKEKKKMKKNKKKKNYKFLSISDISIRPLGYKARIVSCESTTLYTTGWQFFYCRPFPDS